MVRLQWAESRYNPLISCKHKQLLFLQRHERLPLQECARRQVNSPDWALVCITGDRLVGHPVSKPHPVYSTADNYLLLTPKIVTLVYIVPPY